MFLRKLEYSRGVLVLTTNRLHTIDTAFESRIHVILSFPELDKASRKVVWQNFLSLLKQPHNITEEDTEEPIGSQAFVNRPTDHLFTIYCK